jgi:electron transfer flavoprotein beta subunit
MGVILAERLGIPHSTIIMEVQIEGDRLRVKRELEGGWFQWIAMPLPALLTIQSGINQLRYATLKGIMAAKKKEIKKVALPAGLKPAQEIVSLSLPVRSKKTQMIDGAPAEAAKDLVRRLREEARVL